MNPRRARGRANLRAGLWQDTPDETYVPAHDLRIEQETSPLTRPCQHCGAAPGQRCTRPARNGRTDLRGWHPSRLDPSALETQENT